MKRHVEPVLQAGIPTTLQFNSDPMPQALVLTAIVIGFGMTALLVVVALRALRETGSDHVDGGQR